MIPRVFGRVLSVVEESAGDVLATGASASATEIVLEDVTQFGDEEGQAILVNEDGTVTEIVDVVTVDPETDTLTLDTGLANTWAADDLVFVYPYITTRYAYVTATGAEDDAIQAVVPTQVARFLPLGTREDTEQERVTLEWEVETESWVVRDVFTEQTEGADVEISHDGLLDIGADQHHLELHVLDSHVDVDSSGVLDGYVLTFDDSTGDWVAAPGGGGVQSLPDLDDVDDTVTSGALDGEVLTFDDSTGEWIAAPVVASVDLAVTDDTTTVDPVAEIAFDPGDFDVVDAGAGRAEVAFVGSVGAGASFVSIKKWGFGVG